LEEERVGTGADAQGRHVLAQLPLEVRPGVVAAHGKDVTPEQVGAGTVA
jgi:hypothetical protein